MLLPLSSDEACSVFGGESSAGVVVNCNCPKRVPNYMKACIQAETSGAAAAVSLYQAGFSAVAGGQQPLVQQQPVGSFWKPLLFGSMSGCIFGILAEYFGT
jgi:hypothetical protein